MKKYYLIDNGRKRENEYEVMLETDQYDFERHLFYTYQTHCWEQDEEEFWHRFMFNADNYGEITEEEAREVITRNGGNFDDPVCLPNRIEHTS